MDFLSYILLLVFPFCVCVCVCVCVVAYRLSCQEIYKRFPPWDYAGAHCVVSVVGGWVEVCLFECAGSGTLGASAADL